MVLIATLALVLSLALVPAAITASHGPGAYAAALSAEGCDGHVHSWEEADTAQHDATDHEHQTAAILLGYVNNFGDPGTDALLGDARMAVGHSHDGPRRPPRAGVI